MPEKPKQPKKPKKLVLLVDDDLDFRTELKEVLVGEGGFRVVLAANGQEALDYLAKNKAPDILTTDLRMPRLDGLGLLRALKDSEKLSKIPVIVIAGRPSQMDELLSLVEAERFIEKPIDVKRMLGVMRGMVGEG